MLLMVFVLLALVACSSDVVEDVQEPPVMQNENVSTDITTNETETPATETPEEPATNVIPINPEIFNPENYWFEVNGMRIAVGQTVQDILDEGFDGPEEWQLDTMKQSMSCHVFIFGTTLLENSRHSFTASAANSTDTEIAVRDHVIYSAGVDMRTAREADSLVFFHDFQFGETLTSEVESFFGTPTSISEGGSGESQAIYFFYGVVDWENPMDSRGVQFRFHHGDFTLQGIRFIYSPFY